MMVTGQSRRTMHIYSRNQPSSVAGTCSVTLVFTQNPQSRPPVVYIATMLSELYLQFLVESALSDLINILNKAIKLKRSIAMTCDFAKAQPSKASKYFRLPNLNHKVWSKRYIVSRHAWIAPKADNTKSIYIYNENIQFLLEIEAIKVTRTQKKNEFLSFYDNFDLDV